MDTVAHSLSSRSNAASAAHIGAAACGCQSRSLRYPILTSPMQREQERNMDKAMIGLAMAALAGRSQGEVVGAFDDFSYGAPVAR